MLGDTRWVVAVGGRGGTFGRGASAHGLGGISGLLRTVAREHGDRKIRILDIDPETTDPAALAEWVRTELLVIDKLVEVGYVGSGERYHLRPRAVDTAGEGELELDRDSVVLLTGGARGITAQVAIRLARRYQCRLELVGRSAFPHEPEPESLVGATDRAAVRAALIEGGLRDPRVIERESARVLANRQMRATMSAIAEAGSRARYHSVDVRDPLAFGQLIGALYQEHGRIDGVVHGAGVLDDKLIRDKTPEAFARVFDTKVVGAEVLASSLRDDVGFVAFFASISGVFGNRGQADYAAANDALDAIARSMSQRLEGRVVSVDWGPWAGTGMVSEELEREYARRGIGLIDVEQGVDQLLRELANPGDPQVVLMCADPSAVDSREQGRPATTARARG
jgi:NAD(P)-dependent dehydrogenase (short-subunit alcohol dehydrogenase family)